MTIKEKILLSIFCVFAVATLVYAADYDDDKKVDSITAHGGSIAATTRILIQDPSDTDVVTYSGVSEITKSDVDWDGLADGVEDGVIFNGGAITNLDGEQLQNDSVDDDSIDFTDVTLLDFGLAATHDTSAELDALYEAELDNSAGLLAALSDETGTGVAVFSTSPTLVTPILGTITSGVGTSLTALNGENIQNDTIDDDSIDWSDVTFDDFTEQTAWRVFYSNTDGDVTELALGADGTYLKSNGAAAAPTFDTPAGSGTVNSSTTGYVAVYNTESGVTGNDEATFKSAFNMEAGTDYQAYHALLASLAGLTLTDGDLFFASAANAFTVIDSGTSGYVLTAQGAAAPIWSNTQSGVSIGGLTANRALKTSGTGDLMVSTVTDTELEYLSSVTGAIQTQLNNISVGAEVNNLETVATGIASAEIPIGTAADTVAYAQMAGDVTMDNGGNTLIAADAVTTEKIDDDQIDSNHYIAASIDNEHLADSAVDTAELAADAVEGTKIADDQVDSEHYVAGSIDNEHLADNAADSDEIASGAIDLDHMSAESVDSDQYVNGSVDAVHLAADVIDETKIADDGIDSEHYNDASIDLAHLSTDSVDYTKTTGSYKALTPVTSGTTAFAGSFTGANLYGGTYVCNADTGDLTLPSIAAGMNFTIIALGAVEIVVECSDTDDIILDGVQLDDNDSATSTSTAGDIIVFQYYDSDGWLATSNGWTDED